MFKIPTRLYYFLLRHINNETRVRYARLIGVDVGENCRLYSTSFDTEPYLISLGNNVTVSVEVLFIPHDGGVSVLRSIDPTIDYVLPIVVEDNVFIGARAIILPGVIIGANSVVAAGAVVTKSVPPGSIVAGVPARVISTYEAYLRKLKTGVRTKDLSPEGKKRFLLDLWGHSPQEQKQTLLDLEKVNNGRIKLTF
ncbi:MAG: acyltransferase [Anaerolineae bacterium]|nr:acyltransferase [Anaerolineae bacterium]